MALGLVLAACACGAPDRPSDRLAELFAAESADYCAPSTTVVPALHDRPGPGEDPVDDVNWFARPVPHAGNERIVAFASHGVARPGRDRTLGRPPRAPRRRRR
jgi:hypothetical protein